MNERWIECAHCGRRWPAPVDETTYLEMELMSRPCPHCEGYTLRLVSEGVAREVFATPVRRHRRGDAKAAISDWRRLKPARSPGV